MITQRRAAHSRNAFLYTLRRCVYTARHSNHREAASERAPKSHDKLCDWGERAQSTMLWFEWRAV